eukprot:scaffold26653_cov153-Skeletonema_menzelii.AAC.9
MDLSRFIRAPAYLCLNVFHKSPCRLQVLISVRTDSTSTRFHLEARDFAFQLAFQSDASKLEH